MAAHPRYSGENLEKNKLLYKRFSDLASIHGFTPSQLALAWLLHQGNDIVPIPVLLIQSFSMHYFITIVTTKVKNLENNIASLDVKLTDEDVREISDVVPACEVGVFTKLSWRFATTPPK
ncbi:hypothetical protein K1719_029071 [Acacia pycnantha]|nr:hypothetical protein K1719_029071 [Acacia pycnantha]